MTSINSLSGSTTSSYVSRLDKNGDGVVSADELAAANTTSSSSTSSLSLDGGGSDSAAATQLASLVMSMMLQAGTGETQGKPSGEPAPGQVQISDLDTDGNGVISAEEFAAAKPDDVSDDMSANLFSQLDADGNGSVDENELSAMRNGPPPPAGSDQTASVDDDTTSEDLLARLEQIAREYLSSVSGEDDTSTVLTTI